MFGNPNFIWPCYNKQMSEILKVENLTVTLDGVNIIENLNFELQRGENLAIIGPNGSGKTVLLKTLLGFFPYKGEIKWTGDAKLGYVPQKIDADRHLPIDLENLLSAKASILGLSAKGGSPSSVAKPLRRTGASGGKKSAIQEVAEATKLTEKIMKTPIGHLSGGQFQRSLIAFALLGRPNVMLLDEPTASIDQPGEEQIYELLHEIQDKYDITIILVSHDLSVVYRYATEVLCLNKIGLCFGPPESTLTPDVFRKLYGEEHKYVHHLHHEK